MIRVLRRLVIINIIGQTVIFVEIQDKIEKQIVGEAGLPHKVDISHKPRTSLLRSIPDFDSKLKAYSGFSPENSADKFRGF